MKLARKKLPNVAAILMTGTETSEEIRAQMDGYLAKPFTNLGALVDEVRRALVIKSNPQPHD